MDGVGVPDHYRFPLIGELADGLIQRGHEVSVVTTSSSIRERWEYSTKSMSVVILPDNRTLAQKTGDRFRIERGDIAEAIRAFEPDVINAHWLYEFGAAATSCADKAKVRVVSHDNPLDVLRAMRHPYWVSRVSLGWAICRASSTIGVVSPTIPVQIRALFRYSGSTPLLPNWSIEAEAISQSNQTSATDGPFTIATVSNGAGRLKNSHRGLQAFAEFLRYAPDSRLICFGSGSEPTSDLAEWARRRRYDRRVEFRGRTERIAMLKTLRREAHVMLHPSLSEACSVAIIEAMHLGMPIVGGERSGGVPWQLGHGAAGVLVNVSSPHAIASALKLLYDRPDSRAQFAELAQERARSLFATTNGLDRYEEFLFNDEFTIAPVDPR